MLGKRLMHLVLRDGALGMNRAKGGISNGGHRTQVGVQLTLRIEGDRHAIANMQAQRLALNRPCAGHDLRTRLSYRLAVPTAVLCLNHKPRLGKEAGQRVGV